MGPQRPHSAAMGSGPIPLGMTMGNVPQPKKKKSSTSTLASRFQPQPLNVTSSPLDTQPVSIESAKSDLNKYRVVQRLLPDVSLARHIVNSDDHAFASLDECCHDMNNNHTHTEEHFEPFLPHDKRKVFNVIGS